MKNSRQNNLLYDALIILIVLMALVFMCRLWPLILLGILCIFGVVIAMIIRSLKDDKPLPQEAPKQPIIRPASENDVRRLAYGIILRRITELLLADYPEARWVWEEPNAMRRIDEGKELYILLNRAGGYRRARVIIRNLKVLKLEYGSITAATAPEDVPAEPTQTTAEPTDNNYEVIAFEWVEANIISLNERLNDAIGEGLKELILGADELPVKDSWEDVCRELQRSDITEAKCIPEGIKINLLQ